MTDERTGCADDDSDLGRAIAEIAKNDGRIDRLLLSQRIERRITPLFDVELFDRSLPGWARRLRDRVITAVNEEIERP